MNGEARRSLRDRTTEATEASPKRAGAGGGVSMTPKESKKRKATTSANGGELKLADLVGIEKALEGLPAEVGKAVSQALTGLGGEPAEAPVSVPQDEAPAPPVSLAQQMRDAIGAAKERHPKGGEAAYRVAAADLLGRAGPFLAKHQAEEFGVFLLRRPYRTGLCRAFLAGKAWPRPKDVGRGIEAEVAASALRA